MARLDGDRPEPGALVLVRQHLRQHHVAATVQVGTDHGQRHRADHLSDRTEAFPPPADETAKSVDVAVQHSRVLGHISLGDRALADPWSAVEVDERGHRRTRASRQTTESGSSSLPVGPIWISVPISGQTPQS